MVNGVDSLVCLGAWCKGRSSSTQINRLLRRILPWRVFGRKSLENLHMCSEHIPADAPSRLKPLPPRRVPEPLMEALLEAEVLGCMRSPAARSSLPRVFEECFAGCGGLSRAIAKAGWHVDTPLEAFPGKGKNSYRADHDIHRAEVREQFFGKIANDQ